MATILVDYENVGNTNGLRGVDVLKDTDRLIIFYSGCCAKIRQDYLQEIRDSGCEFQVVKLKETRKNALDFYIATECGRIEAEHKYRKEIEELLCGSKYENRAMEIIDFMEAKKEKGRKKLYTGALHLFGKEDGIAIYRMVKDIEKK